MSPELPATAALAGTRMRAKFKQSIMELRGTGKGHTDVLTGGRMRGGLPFRGWH